MIVKTQSGYRFWRKGVKLGAFAGFLEHLSVRVGAPFSLANIIKTSCKIRIPMDDTDS